MRKGFTLIELLAVIVILAIIALIAVPIVINIINDSKIESQKRSIDMYAKAVENAASNYLMKNPSDIEITIEKLEQAKLINYTGDRVSCGVTEIYKSGNIYLTDCNINGILVDYEYGTFELPIPQLDNGLTPVIYDGNNWIVVSKNNPNWYNYNKQMWANAVVLGTDVTKNIGDIVKVDGTEAKMMFVWIPRYEYKYTNLGDQYAGGTKEQPGAIDINFIPKQKTKSRLNNYRVHPAFTLGDKELSGIWVGKFELSHETLSEDSNKNNLGCNHQGCTSDIVKLRILPNVKALINNNVSNFWYAIKNIENTSLFGFSNMDVHMIKNDEWGAVAYLSQSKYGKYGNNDYEGAQKEVYINNSSSYYTGRSGGNISGSTQSKNTYGGSSNTQYSDSGYYTYDGYLINKNTGNTSTTRDINKATGASTTGNIYGIYDMSSGISEFVLGVYQSSTGKINTGLSDGSNSGFNGNNYYGSSTINGTLLPDFKYFNFYNTKHPFSVSDATCNNEICYGHALFETTGWYNDNENSITFENPWFSRGGSTNYDSGAGIFSINKSHGEGNSTRIVLTLK